MLIYRLLILYFFFILVSCKESASEQTRSTPIDFTEISYQNSSSYSNIKEVSFKKLDLELDINLPSKTIYGIARYTINNTTSDTIILDIKDISIQKVTSGTKSKESNISYGIGIEDSIQGNPLVISIKPDTKFITIYYQTNENSKELNWIDSLNEFSPNNYLYLLPNLTRLRSWIPSQDQNTEIPIFSCRIRKTIGSETILLSQSKENKIKDSLNEHFQTKRNVNTNELGLLFGAFGKKNVNSKTSIYVSIENLGNKINYKTHSRKVLNTLSSVFPKVYKNYFDKNIVILPNQFPFQNLNYSNTICLHPSRLYTTNEKNSIEYEKNIFRSIKQNILRQDYDAERFFSEGILAYIETNLLKQKTNDFTADLYQKNYILECVNNEKYTSIKDFSYVQKIRIKNPLYKFDKKLIKIYKLKGLLLFNKIEELIGPKKTLAFLDEYLVFSNQPKTIPLLKQKIKYLLKKEGIKFDRLDYYFNSLHLSKKDFPLQTKKDILIHKLCKDFCFNKNFKKKLSNLKKLSKLNDYEWIQFINYIPPSISKEKLNFLDSKFNLSQSSNYLVQKKWIDFTLQVNSEIPYSYVKNYTMKYGNVFAIYPYYKYMFSKSHYKKWSIDIFEQNKLNYSNYTRKEIEKLFIKKGEVKPLP
jgi:leukotriene-A4 hydrolase